MEAKFVIVCESGYWGKGKTLRDAAEHCVKAGARRGEVNNVAYCYVGNESDLAEIGVTGYGDIQYPQSVTSVRLFGGHAKISLSKIISDKLPKS